MKQAQRSLVSLVVLLAVGGALGAYAYFGVHVAGQEAEAKKDAEAKAFDFEKSAAKKLVLVARGATTELERKGDDWVVTSPVSAAADRSAVGAIVDKMHDLRSKEVVADEQSDLAAHGLDAPKFVVRLTLVDDRQLELRVGEENPFDQSLPYVKSGDPRIFLADSGLKYPLDKALLDLRDKALFALEDQAIRSIESRGAGAAWAAEREGEGWKLTAPALGPGDKSVLDSIVSKLRGARAKDFPTETPPADLSPFGLDAPVLQLTFGLGEGKPAGVFAFGSSDGKGYARHVDGGPIFEVEPSLVTELTKSPVDVRDKTINTFDRAAVRRLEIVPASGETLSITRTVERAEGASYETDKFALVGKPEALKAWKLTGALHTLSTLKGASIAGENVKDLKGFGLDAPRLTYAVFGDGDKELARLLLGDDSGTRAYVTNATGTTVYEVEKNVLEGLPKILADIVEPPAPAPGPAEAASPQ
jgi:hypothetical protein